ncbi:glycosyltransferase family 4 protein [Candidatus Woesearchaeota archaeon]|nr:glycosyltransferase family 4 protein [Candidatus Woesearchaeota archaeon]
MTSLKESFEKRKIRLIIFPGYYVPHIGGLETHVDEFVKYLSRDKNFDITVFAPNIPKTAEFEIRHGKVKVYRYPAFELIPNYPVANFAHPKFWKLLLKIYKEEFNVVMTRTRFFFNTLLGFIFAKIRFNKKKLVHVEHGSAFVKLQNKVKNMLAYTYDKTIGKIIIENADQLIAISEAVRKFLTQSLGVRREIPVIYRGLEFETIDKIKSHVEIKKKFQGKIKLCFVGRLYKWKGVENIIKAYRGLPPNLMKKTVLIIAGYGEDLERLKKISNRLLNKGIYFIGKIDFDKAIAVMKACDIYIHASYPGGGLSNSLLQAMYCGKPVVASPYEGAREVVIHKHNGFLLKHNSPERIRDAITKLIKDKNLRDQLGKNAKKFIKKRFNWEVSVKKYKEILRRMCG